MGNIEAKKTVHEVTQEKWQQYFKTAYTNSRYEEKIICKEVLEENKLNLKTKTKKNGKNQT